jgi:hypothetical protein
MPHFHWLRKQKKKVSLFIWILMHKLLCTQFLHGYTVFSMQEQVPFSMPMEYHHGLFFSFFYARTGAHRGALLYEYHHGLFF